MATTPFGLVAGFTITALPFLLTRAGITLDHVASVSATVMSPTFWGFLLNPLLDTGLSRQTYCWITAGISAVALALAMWALSPQHLVLTTALLLLAELSMVLYGGASGGWTTEFVPESLRGSVGGWTNVANLGAGALGALAVMSVSSRVAPRWIGLGLALAVLAGATPLLAFPAAKKSSFALQQVFSDAMLDIWQASKRRECLVGFALFLAPASAEAAINLFSGLGADFHSNPATVIAVTGAGCAIAASVGSLLGGFFIRPPAARLCVPCGRHCRGPLRADPCVYPAYSNRVRLGGLASTTASPELPMPPSPRSASSWSVTAAL